MKLHHSTTPVSLSSLSTIELEDEEQATARDVPQTSFSKDEDPTEVPEKTQDQPAFEDESEPSLFTGMGQEVIEESYVTATRRGVAAGEFNTTVNVRDNINSDSPSPQLEELHITESIPTVVAFAFAALSQASIGASLAFLPVLLLQLARSTTTFHDTELHLIHSQKIRADYLFLAGIVIALTPCGLMVNKLGRRCSLITATLVSTASWLVHAFTTDATMLFLGRFLAGVSAGLLKLSVTTYIMEVIVVTNRGRVLVCLEMMKILGSVACYGLNIFLSWYNIAFLNAAWMVICLFAFICFPESPAFLLMRQKDGAARKVLQQIRISDTKVDAELQIIKSLNPSERAKCISLFRKPVISNTMILIGLSLLSVFSGSPIFINRGADMLLQVGFRMRMEAAIVLVLTFLSIGCMFLFGLVDKVSRRLCLLISLAILLVVNIALGVISHLTSSTDATLEKYLVLARVCLILINVAAVNLGSHTIPTILAAEYFHAYCRPQGLAMFFTITVLLQALILGLQPLILVTFGLSGLHWIFAIVAFLGIFYTNYCVHDIKYRTHKLPNICRWFYRENLYEPRPIV